MANLRLLTMNDVKLVGRLTRDPEVRYTTQGTAVCRLRLAVNRRYKDKNSGEWKDEVAFVPCVAWRESAERCGQRLKKGSPVYVEGRLRSRDWQTKEGQKRSDMEVDALRVQFLESMGEQPGKEAAPEEVAVDREDDAQPVAAAIENGSGNGHSKDDEVPF